MRIGIFAASAAALLSVAAATLSNAEPLLTQGIGLSSCAKLGPDLKPGAGLDHLPNALMFYWAQGNLSAANFMLLNKYNGYLDVGSVTEPEITKLVFEFCKVNPDKKPISAIDKFIREAPKIAAGKSDALDVWQHKSAAPPSMNTANPSNTVSAAARTADDMKWNNQCVRDNKDEGAKQKSCSSTARA